MGNGDFSETETGVFRPTSARGEQGGLAGYEPLVPLYDLLTILTPEVAASTVVTASAVVARKFFSSCIPHD